MQTENGGAGVKRRSRRGIFARTSVFWQYFLLLSVIVLLAALTQIVSNAWYTRVLTENYMKQTETSFYKNCDLLASSITGTYAIPAQLENTVDYENLQRASAGQLPETAKGLALSRIGSDFYDALNRLPQLSDAEAFVYFPADDAVCTKKRVFTQAEDCFTRYLCYDGFSAEQFLETCRTAGLISCIPQTDVSIGTRKAEPCITFLLRTSSKRSTMGVIYPTKDILSALQFSEMPENSYLRLRSTDGEILNSGTKENGEEYHEISRKLRGVGWEATVGIPHAYFSEQTHPARTFGITLLLITILLGVALCLLFSSMSAMPLRRLLSSYAKSDDAGKTQNELLRLADILASSQMQTKEVGRILSFNLLVRVFSGGVLSQEEEQQLLESYPILNAPCRIAIVHTAVLNEEFTQTAVTELLREHLPESFAAATISRLESGILLPDDADALHELALILDGVNSQLAVDGLCALCGVSAPFTGTHNVYAAVRQARFSVPIRESSRIEVFSAEDNGELRPGVFSWLTHEKLYQAIMNNDEEGTRAFIRNLAADRHAPEDVREVFYSVRFVLRSTARELNLQLPEADLLEYREEMRPKENFRQLEELAGTLFDRLQARRETNAERLSESIVAYLDENFYNPDLSAAGIATHFSLPVKAIYTAVREQTGQSLGDYLTSVRMREAARRLCTTAEGVDAIGVACGYPAQSTFYRVFKKYYGESPNRYRSLH